MNPKVRNLLGVVGTILAIILIAWLLFSIASRFMGKRSSEETNVPTEQTCDQTDNREGCVKCSEGEEISCAKDLKSCKCVKKTVVVQKKVFVQPRRDLCAECAVGYKSQDSIRKNCSHVCQFAPVKEKDKKDKKDDKDKKEKKKQKPCPTCNTKNDIQPNVPGKGPEPPNDTGGGCPSGNCSSGNDIQPNDQGSGPEPPS